MFNAMEFLNGFYDLTEEEKRRTYSSMTSSQIDAVYNYAVSTARLFKEFKRVYHKVDDELQQFNNGDVEHSDTDAGNRMTLDNTHCHIEDKYDPWCMKCNPSPNSILGDIQEQGPV